MTLNEALDYTDMKLHEHGLIDEGWRASVNNRKSCFGVCNYTQKTIGLSSILIPNCNDKNVKETILHEIAHALTPGHHHDKVWKRKCIEVGGNGEAQGGTENYINGDNGFLLKQSKYTATCPECGHTEAIHRKMKRNISCGQHNLRYYDAKYKLIITQNY